MGKLVGELKPDRDKNKINPDINYLRESQNY
jgi:hypothetical protein